MQNYIIFKLAKNTAAKLKFFLEKTSKGLGLGRLEDRLGSSA